MMVDERRIAALEQQVDAVTLRLGRLEEEVLGTWAPPTGEPEHMEAPAGVAEAAPEPEEPEDWDPPVEEPESVAPPEPVAPPDLGAAVPGPDWFLPWPLPPHGFGRDGRPTLEDLLGGRVLAWLGGIAVLVGLAFFFALAVSRGWIGETGRTALAGAGSLGLLTLGVWLHERKGRTDAALAAVATAVAGLFMTLTVGSVVYDVIPVPVALAMALAVGAGATALAIRWRAQTIAALGIVGALLSPVLVGAPATESTAAFLFVAGLSAGGVLLWQRWDWLAFTAFAVITPQWLDWLLGTAPVTSTLATLIAFGTLNAAIAIGHELRLPAARLRPSSSFLLSLNALVLSAGGYYALDDAGGQVAELWLAGLAVAHLAIGLATGRVRRVSHEIRLLVLVIGVILADVALAALADGPALAVCWAATGIGSALLLRRVADRTDQALLTLGLGSHIALSVMHALVVDAPPDVVETGALDVTAAVISVSSIAAACFATARLAGEGRAGLREALDTVGLLAIGYLTAVTLDGLALVGAWALEAVVVARIARREDDPVAAVGACGFVVAALGHALAFEASPLLLPGTTTDVEPALAIGAVTVAAFCCAWLRVGDDEGAVAFAALGGALVLYGTALVLGGAPLTAAWSLEAVVLAGVARRKDDLVAAVGACAFLVAALGHALAFEASPLLLPGTTTDVEPALAIGAVTVAAFCCAWLRVGDDEGAVAFAALGGALVLYATALVLGGAPLATAWALEAAAIAWFARGGDDRVVAGAAGTFLAASAIHVLAFEASPDALVYGVESLPGAAIALTAIALACVAAARLELPAGWQQAAAGMAGLTALYLASVAVITQFQPSATELAPSVLDLDVRQQGQALLSALWGVVGVGALIAGLTRDLRPLRLAALTLLLATVAKVFLYDLAALEAGYRVASFIALGLLLLAGAFAWQRMRPRPLPDLRDVPAGIR